MLNDVRLLEPRANADGKGADMEASDKMVDPTAGDGASGLKSISRLQPVRAVLTGVIRLPAPMPN